MLLLHRGYEMSSNRELLRTTGHSTSGSRPASDAAGPCQRSGSTCGGLRRYLSMNSKAERASIPGDRRQGKAWGLLSSCDENLRRWSVCARGLQRSEEHTSELQSHLNLVCRLLLEKKKTPDNRRSVPWQDR